MVTLATLACLTQACAPPVPARNEGSFPLDGTIWQRQDGKRLAQVFVDKDRQWGLSVFDPDGRKLEEHPLPGPILAVVWSSHQDLLIIGYRLQEFSFGANLSQWLVRLHDGQREQIALGDATLKPNTAKILKDQLPMLLRVAFSPAGDEFVFTRLHDPPQLPAYLELLHRNWQVPAERKLVALPVVPVRITWLPPREAVTWQTGDDPAQQIDLWPDTFAPAAQPAAAVESERLWALRKWRFAGLITPAELQKVITEKQP